MFLYNCLCVAARLSGAAFSTIYYYHSNIITCAAFNQPNFLFYRTSLYLPVKHRH